MKFLRFCRIAFPFTLFLFSDIGGVNVKACEFQSLDNAIRDSTAIFLGKAVEERVVPMESKGGTDLSYKEVNFEVSKSWKLIDRKSVWVRVPAKLPGCGYDGVGREYLVYANQLNDLLYIPPASRTMLATDATEDLAKLAVPKIDMSEGVFFLFRFRLILIMIITAVVLLICYGLVRVSRRPM